eukprot:GHVR01016023.1.p1 GENE.GHVR01016023.1~~GHVR01016023.1.p1  ORF type:complete len:104 (-),score=27.05 GHVR01016023.1:72-383(-)
MCVCVRVCVFKTQVFSGCGHSVCRKCAETATVTVCDSILTANPALQKVSTNTNNTTGGLQTARLTLTGGVVEKRRATSVGEKRLASVSEQLCLLVAACQLILR